MSDESCPWNTHPKTIEEMIDSCEAQSVWEYTNNGSAPMHWCIVPTRQMFLSLCLRLKFLEGNR